MIHVIGLGPGDPERLPPRAFALLTRGLPVLVRTMRHPVWTLPGPLADAVLAGLLQPTPLDDEYESNQTFDDTYDAIVERVVRAAAADGEIVYAVPGHPLVGETTVARLLERARRENIRTEILGAPSFIDAVLEAVGQSATGDLHIIDALSLRADDAAPDAALRGTRGPLLLYQIHSRDAASQTKLALMRAGYPDDYTVTLIHAAGVPGAQMVRDLPLYTIDRDPDLSHLTSLWVTPLPPEVAQPGFDGLVRIMARLRDPNGGCPWDLKQTHLTLRKYVIEEAYEVVEAIDGLDSGGDPDTLCEELGDLLLQVVFHAQLAAEDGYFDAEDVCRAIVEKMVRRHPHIFGDTVVADADEVLKNWNAIKAGESGKEYRLSILDGMPAGLPALMRALETSKRVVKVGFEWPDVGGVLAKVDEEIAELRVEVESGASQERIFDELGDLLFTIVNVARHLGVDPEEALRAQVARFTRRFHHIEAGARRQERALDSLSLAEMELLWQEAKQKESPH
jgi:tetrapyrrole methylase family protein/MazG family protein